jgi:hypothetical protein
VYGPRYRPAISPPHCRTRHAPDVEFLDRRTERLLIRRFGSDDAPSLAAYRCDPSVARFQGWDVPFSIVEADAFVANLIGSDPDTPGEWFQFAVVELASGSLIGDVAALVDADDARLATIVDVQLATRRSCVVRATHTRSARGGPERCRRTFADADVLRGSHCA